MRLECNPEIPVAPGEEHWLLDTSLDEVYPVTHVAKVHENYNDNVMTLLESGKVVYVVSTSAKGRDPVAESVKLRRLAVERDIDCLTAIDTANTLADCLASKYSLENVSLVNINSLGRNL